MFECVIISLFGKVHSKSLTSSLLLPSSRAWKPRRFFKAREAFTIFICSILRQKHELQNYAVLLGKQTPLPRENSKEKRELYLLNKLSDPLGAKNVISACQECRVRCLIYNDSVDVVDGGLHDIHDGDEWLVSTWKTNNTLNDLKAQVEALILSANDIDGVLTCSLRPSNVFGLGDPEFVPYFLKLSRYGFSKKKP
ncbi:hypothetical protein JHK87_024305 [Glycine soja]|nr:hypothetical protein JHK87_024305 [Glycine soja]